MTSASSSNDLTNLRWQYIRSIETNQLLQDEIISLKSILKSKDAHELIQQNEIKKKNIKLKASLSEFKNKFIMMRSDLQNVKKNYIHDMSQMNSNFIQLK